MLHENSYHKLFYISNALNNTVKYYKKLYYENDYYRQKRIMEIVRRLDLELDRRRAPSTRWSKERSRSSICWRASTIHRSRTTGGSLLSTSHS